MGFKKMIDQRKRNTGIDGIIEGILPSDGNEHVLFYKSSQPFNLLNKPMLENDYTDLTNEIISYLNKTGYKIIDIKFSSVQRGNDTGVILNQTMIMYK